MHCILEYLVYLLHNKGILKSGFEDELRMFEPKENSWYGLDFALPGRCSLISNAVTRVDEKYASAFGIYPLVSRRFHYRSLLNDNFVICCVR